MKKTPAIGIDLGTAYSCVGIFQNGKVEIIPNDRGNKSTPSCVAFTENVILVGDAAKEQATRNPRNTIFGAKRLIGRKFGESTPNNDTNIVEEYAKHCAFEVINDRNKPKYKVKFNGGYETYFPEEISAMVLEKMKETAEAYLGVPIENAVISVPAYFNDLQRKATIDAAAIAKLNVLRLINEPTAAAIAYSLERKGTGKSIYALIFDLGAGTLDVTIANIIDKGIRVMSTSGNTHLGGEDFDTKVMNHFAKEFQYEHEKNLKQDPRDMHRLRTACEQTKITLSSATRSNIEIDSLHENVNFSTQIFRTHFEKLNAHSFRNILHSIEKAIRDSGLDKSQIHDIILVGGSSRIPKIQEILGTFFNAKHLKRLNNADEAVAYGATIQAAILNGDLPENTLQVFDVTALSFGLSNNKNEMVEFIKRNADIPTKKTKIYNIKFGKKLRIQVYEGEYIGVELNNFLGEISHGPIFPRFRDVVVGTVEATFSVDANGILNVRVIDKLAKSNNPIILHEKYRLNEYDIKGIIEKNKKYKAKDEERKSARNSLEMYCDEVKRFVQSNKFKNRIYESEKNKIFKKCDDTVDWLHANSSAEKKTFERKQKELITIFDLIFAAAISDPNERYEKYCKLFNIRVGASKDEIQKSFRQMARKYHPDKFEGDEDISNWMFIKITDIKNTLIDLAKQR